MIEVIKTLKKKKTMVIAIALIVILLFTFKVIADKNPSEQIQASNTITVEVQKVKETDLKKGLTYKANLEPVEEATVCSSVSGLVTQVLFEAGDKVNKGQVLVCLDDKDLQNQLRSAEIDLNKLQLDLNSARTNYETAKELYVNGASSKITFDDAERAYKTAQANIELKKVSIQAINNSINDCSIKAPISGEVGEKSINIGQYANQGTAMAKIKNNSSIKALLQLKQEDIEKVAIGQEVNLILGKDTETDYKGVIKTIAASANNRTRVFDCLVEVDNASGTINSGIFATIKIPSKDNKQAIVIPMSAVTGSEGNYSVFTIEKNVAHRNTVEIGEMENEMVEIISGIQKGDYIIISNLNSLQDGDKVKASGKGV